MANASTFAKKVSQLINKIASEHNYKNHKILLSELSSGGANYTSKLFTAIVREENKQDLHLFAKVATMGEAFRKNLPIDLYKTEQFSYLKLAKIYASLEEQNGVPEEHRLYFPKCYGFDPTAYQEIMVLENLMAHGYGPHDRFQSIDWEYASSAVANLAKMHALSFALSKQSPEEFKNSLATLHTECKETESMTVMFNKATSKAVENVKPEYREALQNHFGELKHPFISMNKTVRSTVIAHGDFRGNNLMHKVREDGKVDIKIVDLQTLHGASPINDLLLFSLTTTDEEFRAKYFQKLLDHYYSHISASMKRLNLDPEETFSREDFEFEMKEKLPAGLSLAVYALPLVTVDSENAPEVNESLELSNFSVERTSALYAERLNGIVNDYVKWGILKK